MKLLKIIDYIAVLSLDQVWEKFYKDRYFKAVGDMEIARSTFNRLVDTDPTSKKNKMGKYSDRVLRWYLDLLERHVGKYDPYIFGLNTDITLKTDLELFHKLGPKVKKLISGKEADINTYKTIQDFVKFIKYWREKRLITKDEAKKEVKVLYKDSEWIAVTPETYEASCVWRSGAHWCTGLEGESGKGHYNTYMKKSPLIIVVNLKDKEKYQFTKKSPFRNGGPEYMNKENRPQDMLKFVTEMSSDGLRKALRKHLPIFKYDEEEDFIEEMGEGGDMISYEDWYDSRVEYYKESWMDYVSQDFLQSFLDMDAFEERIRRDIEYDGYYYNEVIDRPHDYQSLFEGLGFEVDEETGEYTDEEVEEAANKYQEEIADDMVWDMENDLDNFLKQWNYDIEDYLDINALAESLADEDTPEEDERVEGYYDGGYNEGDYAPEDTWIM